MTAIVIGAFLGLIWGGPFGALLGGFLGRWIDRNFIKSNQSYRQAGQRSYNRQRAQSAFFRASFLVMGRIAKADGRVSEDEIQMASAIMREMRLSEEQRRAAIELFNQGKNPSTDISEALAEFRRVAGSSTLIPMFLEIQLQAAYADGGLTQSERVVFRHICDQLGVSQLNFELLHKRFQAQQAYYHHAGQQQAGGGGGWGRPGRDELKQAYQILGVEPSATDAEVKRAYRKLMSQHHPDKLVAKGLPEEMMEVAKQKTQEIQGAYDHIRNSRK
ncbi:co-chaperone DjlA [Endozoicomonas gorgoniicola]|uniref:Co-chaperone protein DjlA n=1 Tax=Endozoicomonas gorgoniicola TaxID=1234144 RepID=A0ABT3MPB7_9GAMM|nr:co-chaperone DjlA [Endozoicomonas gorgoniicola]MCW7551191.1 co-chaperone DjlA [Endozoicomonas gorgoniicola]